MEKQRAPSLKGRTLLAALSGLAAVVVFCLAFLILGLLHPNFDLLYDFVSKLGGKGQPNAVAWNLLGFGLVGLLFAVFGWNYGVLKNDRLLGGCLVFAGVGFLLGAVPTDFSNSNSPLSKAHFASICLALAGYCFGLARLTGSKVAESERIKSQWVIGLAILPVVCVSSGISAEPVAHRVILFVVFAWVVESSLNLLTSGRNRVVE